MVDQDLTWAPWVQLYCSVPWRTTEKVEQNLIKFLIILQAIPDYVVKDIIEKANWFLFFFLFYPEKKITCWCLKQNFNDFPP